MQLYKISDNYAALMDMSGEIPQDALQDTLEGIQEDFNDKAIAIRQVLKNMDTTAIDEEIKRLQAIKKRVTTRKEWLTNYLRENMIECGIQKIDSDLVNITLRKAGKKLEIVSEKEIPANYQTLVPASWTINRAQITKDLKAGIDVPGCELVDAKQGLTIK